MYLIVYCCFDPPLYHLPFRSTCATHPSVTNEPDLKKKKLTNFPSPFFHYLNEHSVLHPLKFFLIRLALIFCLSISRIYFFTHLPILSYPSIFFYTPFCSFLYYPFLSLLPFDQFFLNFFFYSHSLPALPALLTRPSHSQPTKVSPFTIESRYQTKFTFAEAYISIYTFFILFLLRAVHL